MTNIDRALRVAIVLAVGVVVSGCGDSDSAQGTDAAPSFDAGTEAGSQFDAGSDAGPGLDAALRLDAPTEGGSSADRLARMLELCYEWADIVCGANQTCCAADERTNEAECRMSYHIACDVTHHGVAYDDGRIRLDVAVAETAIANVRALAAACDPDATPDLRAGTAGTTPLGGDCTPLADGFGVGRDASALWSCVPGLVCHVTMVTV